MNSRLNAPYLPSYRLICQTKSVLFLGILKYMCDIIVKKSSRSLSDLPMSSCNIRSTLSKIRLARSSATERVTLYCTWRPHMDRLSNHKD